MRYRAGWVMGARPSRHLAEQWRREFAERGLTFAPADCVIAAAAVAIGARRATGNKMDFPMQELEVDHWPVGA
jgi:predicted nucleic acid-binding protein